MCCRVDALVVVVGAVVVVAAAAVAAVVVVEPVVVLLVVFSDSTVAAAVAAALMGDLGFGLGNAAAPTGRLLVPFFAASALSRIAFNMAALLEPYLPRVTPSMVRSGKV